MAILQWDSVGEKLFETGVSKGVIYLQDAAGAYPLGVAWNGLSAFTENPSGAELTPVYANNKKYLNLQSAEDFGGTIEAYTYPDEFGECNGEREVSAGVIITQQERKKFGFVCRSEIGNDVAGSSLGYKLHLVYGAIAMPSEKAHSTINETPEAVAMSWEISTEPVEVSGYKPTAHLVIDSTKVTAPKLALLEAELFGTADDAANLPLPEAVFAIFAA